MTEKRPRGRPPTGETPQRTVRIPDETWEKATTKAATEGRTVSDVVRRCLDEYVEDEK